jgi:hypothetical protein
MITLSQADLKLLIALARRERRLPSEQAAVFVVRGLAAEALEEATLTAAPTRQPDGPQEREAPA